MTPPVRPFGDRAFLVPVADVGSARAVARAVEHARAGGAAPAGTVEVLTGLDSVVVRLDPAVADDEVLRAWLTELAAPGAGGVGARDPDGTARTVGIPVDFDGPDLAAVAEAIGDTPSSVVDRLTAGKLEVALLGFSPGFPYLVGLPPELAAIPRRATPRASVPGGSVAIGGGFASVYPQSSPGGWMVLGHTSTRLFDPDHPPFALLQPGDTVRFSVAGPGADRAAAGQPAAGAGPARPPLTAGGTRSLEVLEPGLLTVVVDLGRRGLAGLGVPEAGPADPESMQLANRLVGNGPGAASIEITARGPTVRFGCSAHLAVVASAAEGVDVDLDGHPVGTDLVVPVRPAQVLTVGPVRRGLRAYLAVAGGIDTPLVVGSRSSDQLSGLGPGPLVAGDRLDLGVPARPHGQLVRAPPGADPAGPIRVVLGPHPFATPATEALCAAEWSVAPDSNRIGLRLDGRPLPADRPPVTSTAMLTGAIQVPPDGSPIILMVDHATLGGYPVIAAVITADLARLGQLRPGDHLAFSPVSPAGARRIFERRTRALAESVSGWFPTATAT